MHRTISQLQTTSLLERAPKEAWDKSRKRSKGSRRKGFTFENKIGRILRDLDLKPHSGQWIGYVDENGIGYAQPDHYIIIGNLFIICIECKLTQTQTAFLQMSQLYVPLLNYHYGLPVYTLQACHNVRYRPERETTIEDLIRNPSSGNYTWHVV